MYDYRHELLEILRHTTSDPASLSQTQRSLTTILRLLNQLQPFDEREETPLSTHNSRRHDFHNAHHDGRAVGGHEHRSHRFRMRQRRDSQAVDSTVPVKESNESDHEKSEAMPNSVRGDFAALLDRSLSNAADQHSTESLDEMNRETRHHLQSASDYASQAVPLTEAELAAQHHYIVHRKLSGAMIDHQYYPESILHELPFELNDGDVVATAAPHSSNELPKIKEITDDHLPRQVQSINVIHHAILKAVNGTKMLQIESTRDGDSILDRELGANILINPKHYPNRNLKPGMEVDYAYYDHGNALRDAKSGTIRWVYEETAAASSAKQSSGKKQESKAAKAKPAAPSKPSPVVIDDDFDLKQRKTLVISAKPDRNDELKAAVDDHHGIYYRLDASRVQNVTSSKLKAAIRQADLVVICQDGIDKKTTELAQRHAQKYAKPATLATASDKRALDHALARLAD
ncbi:hypothetical protein [Limosilactobacillus difficilis]|uniref:hypothetical protein n=1 Tax=Limosilactobacillus difficilis TaxID=2991838 RepID=UPI0024BB3B4E|nr:hypothetical protein [Limosilactobacillus difficilis]